jgi:hypothetical protein
VLADAEVVLRSGQTRAVRHAVGGAPAEVPVGAIRPPRSLRVRQRAGRRSGAARTGAPRLPGHGGGRQPGRGAGRPLPRASTRIAATPGPWRAGSPSSQTPPAW